MSEQHAALLALLYSLVIFAAWGLGWAVVYYVKMYLRRRSLHNDAPGECDPAADDRLPHDGAEILDLDAHEHSP